MFICKQKVNLIPLIFNRYYTLKNPAIWLAKNIMANNSKTRILPDMRFLMDFHFALFLEKKKKKNQKNEKQKTWTPSIFTIHCPLASCKKSEKTNEPILRKTLN